MNLDANTNPALIAKMMGDDATAEDGAAMLAALLKAGYRRIEQVSGTEWFALGYGPLDP